MGRVAQRGCAEAREFGEFDLHRGVGFFRRCPHSDQSGHLRQDFFRHFTASHPEACLIVETLLSKIIGEPAKKCCEYNDVPRCCFTLRHLKGEDPVFRDTVTLRERDSMKQERVKIEELLQLLLARVS